MGKISIADYIESSKYLSNLGMGGNMPESNSTINSIRNTAPVKTTSSHCADWKWPPFLE